MCDTQLLVWDNGIFKTFVCREVKLKGISTPRGSLQMGGVKEEAGELTVVTCDKVSLTKHEYVVTAVSTCCFSNGPDNHAVILFWMFTFRCLRKNPKNFQQHFYSLMSFISFNLLIDLLFLLNRKTQPGREQQAVSA